MAKKENPTKPENEIGTEETKPTGFDEWLCQCTRLEGGKVNVKKLSKERSGVQITEEQAEILNDVQYGNNPVPVLMYFPAE